jgi:polyhydroxybutyrate depolymerase
MKMLLPWFVLTMAMGCGSTDNGNTGGSGGTGGTGGVGGTGGQAFSPDPPLVIGTEERPAEVDIPSDYDPTVPYPLVMVLHGRGTDGRTQTGYLQLFNFVDSKQFILLFPNGTLNQDEVPVWNGAVCCADNDNVDDVGYLSALIEEAEQTYNIDPKRVYLVGHSNGGFMSFRMACEVPTLFTAMVSLAGGTYEDPADCQPGTPPVSVLVVHGTADDTVAYEGTPGFSPGAVEIVERSAASAGCNPDAPTSLGSIDLVPALEGAETDIFAYSTGCDEGLNAELWTINDGPHIPFFQPLDSGKPLFPDLITDWLFRHSR